MIQSPELHESSLCEVLNKRYAANSLGVHETAEILGIPGNTVKNRMFHARQRLLQLLAEGGVGGALA